MKKVILSLLVLSAIAMVFQKSKKERIAPNLTRNQTVNSTVRPTADSAPLDQVDARVDKIQANQQVVDSTTASLRNVDQVLHLSEKIFLNDDDKLILKESLLNLQTIRQVRSTLRDADFLDVKNFKKRLKYLDTLYAGLKFQDAEVREVYGKLAIEVLTQAAAHEILIDRKRAEQFFGDRVEIALSLSKMDLALFKTIREEAEALNPSVRKYFIRAKSMNEIYQVVL